MLPMHPRTCFAQKIPRGWTSRSGRGFEGYAEALALQRVNGAAANVLGIATIVVVGAQVLVVGLASQEMVDGDEDSVGDGNDRFLVPAVLHDASVAGGEGAGGRVRAGAEGGLDQRAAQPAVAFARPARSVLAGTLVVAGAQACPTGEMPRRGEHAHVDAELGDEDLRGALVHAWDRIEAGQVVREGDDHGVDLGAHRLDRLVEVVEVGKDLRDQKGVMPPEAPTSACRKAGSFLRSLP